MTTTGEAVKPLVSVCIAHYCDGALLRACLQSVLAQRCDFPFDVLVHDDASPDGSGEVALEFPGVALISAKENVGYCVANNRLACAANGTYLLLLNNDAELLPGALQALANEARRLRVPAILGLPQYDAATGQLVDRGRLCDPFLNGIPNLDPDRIDVAMVAGACLWIPKSLWHELSGFPEWFVTLAEDLYLCSVARLKGYQVRALSESGYLHWIGKSIGGGAARGSLQTTIRRRALSERNKCFTLLICYPNPWHWMAFALHVLLLAMEGLALAAATLRPTAFPEIYVYALRSSWSARSKLLRLRHEVQSFRRVSARAYFSVFRFFPYKLSLLFRYGIPRIR